MGSVSINGTCTFLLQCGLIEHICCKGKLLQQPLFIYMYLEPGGAQESVGHSWGSEGTRGQGVCHGGSGSQAPEMGHHLPVGINIFTYKYQMVFLTIST